MSFDEAVRKENAGIGPQTVTLTSKLVKATDSGLIKNIPQTLHSGFLALKNF